MKKLYISMTNLEFQPDGAMAPNPERAHNAIFALFQYREDAFAVNQWMTALWVKSVRRWDFVRDLWQKLSEEEEKIKPFIYEREPAEVDGWPKKFGLQTGLRFKMYLARWKMEIADSESITAVFRRFDDAKAVSDYMDRFAERAGLTVPDELRPRVVSLIPPPDWTIGEEEEY